MGEIVRFPGVSPDEPSESPFPDPDNSITIEFDSRELAQAFLEASFKTGSSEAEGMAMDILVTRYGQAKAQQIRDDARTRFDLFQQNPTTHKEKPKAPHLRLDK